MDSANSFYLTFKKPLLWLLGYSAILAYLVSRMPLIPFFRESLDTRKFFPSLNQGVLFSALILLAFLCYGVILSLLKSGRWSPRLSTLLVVGGVGMGLAILIYPHNANDIYRYVLRGRITLLYGGNPFTDPPAAFSFGQLNQLAGEWVDATSPYGPLWELIATGPISLTRDPLLQIIGFKLLVGFVHLLIGLMLYQHHHRDSPSFARWAAAAWLLNPALLLIVGADGHNDVLMLAFLTAGWLLMRQSGWAQLLLGLLVMWLGVMIKAIALLVVPLFGLYALRQLPDWGERRRFVAAAAVGVVLLTVLCFAPFGSPLALVSRLLDEASAGASFSPMALAILLQVFYGQTITLNFWENFTLVGTLIGALWTGWRVWHGRSPLQEAANLFLIYLLLAFNFRVWYTAWPFLFLLLDRHTAGWRLTAGQLFLLSGYLAIFVYSHLFFYELNFEPLLSHRLGVPLVFVAPPLLGWLTGLLWPTTPSPLPD